MAGGVPPHQPYTATIKDGMALLPSQYASTHSSYTSRNKGHKDGLISFHIFLLQIFMNYQGIFINSIILE